MDSDKTPEGGNSPGGDVGQPATGSGAGAAARSRDTIIGATIEGLRRAAEEVEQVASLAETLQRRLLPEKLPDVPGLACAGRYVAGGTESRVGGDWYDVVALRDGHAGLVIGDVVGHGLAAAARMARFQSALRAYGLDGLRPSLVLERMNGFAREAAGDPMATVLYAIIDPNEGSMRMASAGHPPPLVISADGDAYFTEGPAGSPLGVVSFPAYEEYMVRIPIGSTLLLYTDGLVERPDASLEHGLRWLRDFTPTISSDPEELCSTLLESRFRGRRPHDDVAILAVRLEPVGDRLEVTLPAEPESLATMRRVLSRWLRATGASEQLVYELLVACGEACANTIAHAYPPGDASYVVEAQRVADSVEIQVRDFGSWRAPHAGSHGRGLRLIDELTDDLKIDRGPAGTLVSMRRSLRGAGPSA